MTVKLAIIAILALVVVGVAIKTISDIKENARQEAINEIRENNEFVRKKAADAAQSYDECRRVGGMWNFPNGRCEAAP